MLPVIYREAYFFVVFSFTDAKSGARLGVATLLFIRKIQYSLDTAEKYE